MVSTIRGRYLRWGVILALGTGCGDDSVDPDTSSGTEGSVTSSTGPGTSDDTSADSGTGTGTGTGSSGDVVDDTTGTDSTVGATDSGTDSGTDTSTSTETGEESSSGEEGSTDTGMMAEGCYDPMVYPYAGSLCGPAGSPCSVIIDEELDGPHFRNDAPSVTLDSDCEPQVLYSVAEGGFNGHFARRTGPDTWDDQLTPFAIATGGAAYDPTTGDTRTVTDDGAFGIQVWRWDGAWTMEDVIDPYHLNTHGVGHRGNGTVHTALRTDGSDLRHGIWDGGFGFDDYGVQAQSASIAVGPGDTPHVAFWRSNTGWEMWWGTTGQTELVAPGLTSALQLSQRAVAVVDDGGDGVPHLTFATQTAPDGLHEVVHATRTGPGTWEVTPVASEDPAMNTLCNSMPFGPGEQCMYDYVRVRPLDIVASDGGDVRVLFARDHFEGTLQSNCMPGPGGGFCSWQPFITNDTSDLHIAWPDPTGGFADTVLVSDAFVRSMTAQVDIDGQVHIAAYVGLGDTSLRYFRVGERT